MKVKVAVPNEPDGVCGPKATLKQNVTAKEVIRNSLGHFKRQFGSEI